MYSFWKKIKRIYIFFIFFKCIYLKFHRRSFRDRTRYDQECSPNMNLLSILFLCLSRPILWSSTQTMLPASCSQKNIDICVQLLCWNMLPNFRNVHIFAGVSPSVSDYISHWPLHLSHGGPEIDPIATRSPDPYRHGPRDFPSWFTYATKKESLYSDQ
jgi:hypothetical protein